MKDLQIIDQRKVLGKDFKIYGDFENTLFLAKDVAEWIDYSKTGNGSYDVSKMIMTVDESEKLTGTIFVSGQNREMWFVTEDGLMEILFQSRKPIAKEFKKQVKEILRTIRKHGVYATEELLNNPDFLIKALTELKAEREEKKVLQLQNAQQSQIINELKPKADYTDLILKSKGLVTITQIAKDYGMSGQSMNKLLHELKVQYNQGGQWLLYAIIQDRGYTHSETTSFKRSDGRPDVSMLTKWTQKGRLYLYELLKANNVLPSIEL